VTRFLGVDLAWGEGTPRKKANETGLALLDDTGRVLGARWARGIDEVAEWIVTNTEPDDVVAIDAPLVVRNLTGMRRAERQVGMGYGRWKVAANASNTGVGWQGGIALRRRLESVGFVYASGLEPAPQGTRTFFECYPYTTLVGMHELGYDDERPRYKRLDRTLPVAEGRRRRAAACDELIRRMAGLEASDPPMSLHSHPLTRGLLDTPSPIDDVPHKHREDLLDAVLCAWTAAIRHRHGAARMQVLGEGDEPDDDGRVATILAPARPEQRVAGRPLRVPTGARYSRRSERMVPIVSASAAGFASSPTR